MTALAVLVALVFSKYFYLTSLSSYYTFFLMHRFGIPVRCSCDRAPCAMARGFAGP